ncbi:MAG: hypothetical protein WC314_26610 [Vulcanimicrobiota bacterium]
MNRFFCALPALCLFLLLSQTVSAQQSFFNDRLRLPGMDGFQRFTEGQGSSTRWNPKSSESPGASSYLLSDPAGSLWVTVRLFHLRPGSDPQTTKVLYQAHFETLMKNQKLSVTASKITPWPGGEAYSAEIKDFMPGYSCRSLCLFPQELKPNSPVYLISIVTTTQAAAKGQNLSKEILQKASLKP